MNGRHRKTLAEVFDPRCQAGIDWLRIEALLLAVGCRLVEGRGSRVRFVHGSNIATFHRPYPAKEAKPYQVADARDFLQTLGIRP